MNIRTRWLHDHPGRFVDHVQLGVFRAERGDVYGCGAVALTFVMGLVFVLGQVNEYRNLVAGA